MANFLRPAQREATAGVVNGKLIVVGTDGVDFLQATRCGASLTIWANGVQLGQFAVTVAGLVIDAGEGNDLIWKETAKNLETAVTRIYNGKP